MPTLVLHDVPVEVYEKLVESASRTQLSPEEAVKLLLLARFAPEANNGQNGSTKVTPTRAEGVSGPWPDEPMLTEEISAPFDLPHEGPGVLVKAKWGKASLPDPID